MENPRPDKVAIVSEIAGKLSAAPAVFVSEYRGMTVGALATLRGSLREVGAEHKVYKNTLAKLAIREAGLDVLDELLVGPTSITFTGTDTVGAAKALHGASRTNPLLVLKGGALGASLLSADDIKALAELPSRDELLARFAGALQAPLVKTAGLLQALPRNFAYGLSALIESKASGLTAAPHPSIHHTSTTRKRIIMATKEEILDSISELTVLELKDLLDAFEERFGVTAAAPVAVAAAAPAGGGEAAAPPRSRTSSTSSSPAPAPRRSRSSRSCAS